MIGNWELNGLDEADLHYALADANADAARRLTQDMLDGTYPTAWSHATVLMSLVHHSVELFLKYAIARAGRPVPRHHYIRDLLHKYLAAFPSDDFAFEPPYIVHFMGLSAQEVSEALQDEESDRNQTDQMLRYHTDRNGSPWMNPHGFLAREFLVDTTTLHGRMNELRNKIEETFNKPHHTA
ncbi:MAG: hypothetical protein A2498_06190 [Lentisphaerae bacterium RIFOXYC12_FULL_60_16]|nr:MAG: hypothetical protein A2498_06190 [Lentisphaerae bacterium RIFOXYC12_FULL_60_16]